MLSRCRDGVILRAGYVAGRFFKLRVSHLGQNYFLLRTVVVLARVLSGTTVEEDG